MYCLIYLSIFVFKHNSSFIAFFNIPIIFASVDFWAAEIQSHPKRVMSQQPSHVLAPFFFSLFSFTMLFFTMLLFKIKVLYSNDKRQNYV